MPRRFALVVTALCTSCASAGNPPALPRSGDALLAPKVAAYRARIAPDPAPAPPLLSTALRLDPKAYDRFDARFAADALRALGRDAAPTAASLRSLSTPREGSPLPGDLLFFSNGAVAIVERADPTRILFVYAHRSRLRRGAVDPLHPQLRRSPDGTVHNTFLLPMRENAPHEPHLAGELLEDVRAP